MEDATGIFLGIIQNAGWRDRADPAFRLFHRLDGLRIVDRHLATGIDNGTATGTGDPFQGIAGQALISAALPYISLQAGLTGCLLTGHDGLGGHCQFAPGLRHRFLILGQQILAVIEQPGIDEPGCGDQLAAHSRILQ